MIKRIENKDTGNWVKFKATESKITFLMKLKR